MGINRVFISGNLTRDAEIRSTQSGASVLGFGVAVNDRRKNQRTGEWEDFPNFVDCTLFGRRAEALAQYLVKGTKVAIEGRLRYSSWQDRETGKNRSKLDVVVEEVEFMSSRQQPAYAAQAPAQQPARAVQAPAYQQGQSVPQAASQGGYGAYPAQQQMAGMPQPAYSDDDIPFD